MKCLPTLNCLKVIERVLGEQRMRAVNAQVGAAVFVVERSGDTYKSVSG